MSEETKEAEFGGWRKKRGKQVYEPKEGHPYVVTREETDGNARYVATRSGDNPETLRETHLGKAKGMNEKKGRELAQHACEEHWRQQQTEPKAVKLGVATTLDWQYDDETGTWTAPGPDGRTYICEQEAAGWWAQLDDEELSRPVELELAKAICQRHRDTELAWKPDGACYVAAHGYHCDPAPDGGWGAWAEEELLDTFDEAEQAQGCCQEHHRELVGPPDVKPEKPERRELVTRSILCKLTPEEHAAAGTALAKAQQAVEHAEVEIASAAEAYKGERKRLEGILEAKKEESRKLRQPALYGEEHRELQVHEQLGPDPGDGTPRELIFTDPETGEVLDSRPATKTELQKWLPQCGGPDDPPADKPPPEPHAPPLAWTEDSDDDGAWAARSGPYAASSAGETDPLPPDLDLSDKRQWKRLTSGAYIAGEPEGDNYYVDKSDSGLWQVSLYLDKRRRELPGNHTRLRDAFAGAHADNQHRLRWPAQTMICLEHLRVIITVCGRYQLHQIRGLDDSWPDAWRAELVGVLGQPNTQLNSDDGQPLLEAQAACQADAELRRGGL
jgi:hypothetical protein